MNSNTMYQLLNNYLSKAKTYIASHERLLVKIAIFWYSFNLFCAIGLPRFSVLIESKTSNDIISASYWGCCLFSALILLRQRFLLFAGMLTTFLSIYLHSFGHIYWPSLRLDIPIQDYLLADQVSSHYSFHYAKLYLKYLLVFLVPALLYVHTLQTKQQTIRILLWPLLSICAAFMINIAAAHVQAFIDPNFLAEGSGTALKANRYPGLLEDSGASGVVQSMLLCGLLCMLLFAKIKGYSRILFYFLTAGSISWALFSNTRIVFASLLIISLVYVVALIIQAIHARKKIAVLYMAVPATVFIAALYFAPTSIWKTISQLSDSFATQQLGITEGFHHFLVKLDAIRAVHIKTMAMAFRDHSFFGTGLGFFYANYFEYLQEALKTGGKKFADPPASMYLMLLSELGLVGLTFVSAFLIFCFKKFLDLISKNTHSIQNVLEKFMAGLAFGLAVCFLIGIHLIFRSTTALISLVLACVIYSTSQFCSRRFGKYSRILGFLPALILLCNVGYLYFTAPKVPYFRWTARGKPQLPLSMVIESPALKAQGHWLVEGAELLMFKPSFTFYVKSDFSSKRAVRISLFDQKDNLLEEQTFFADISHTPLPGEPFEIVFAEKSMSTCLSEIGPDNFCSIRINTAPTWNIAGQSISVFIKNEDLIYKNSNLKK